MSNIAGIMVWADYEYKKQKQQTEPIIQNQHIPFPQSPTLIHHPSPSFSSSQHTPKFTSNGPESYQSNSHIDSFILNNNNNMNNFNNNKPHGQ